MKTLNGKMSRETHFTSQHSASVDSNLNIPTILQNSPQVLLYSFHCYTTEIIRHILRLLIQQRIYGFFVLQVCVCASVFVQFVCMQQVFGQNMQNRQTDINDVYLGQTIVRTTKTKCHLYVCKLVCLSVRIAFYLFVSFWLK